MMPAPFSEKYVSPFPGRVSTANPPCALVSTAFASAGRMSEVYRSRNFILPCPLTPVAACDLASPPENQAVASRARKMALMVNRFMCKKAPAERALNHNRKRVPSGEVGADRESRTPIGLTMLERKAQ